MSKICFITAIYGNYEASCKKFVRQTVPTDFICFTDNHTIVHNGWIIDTTPYHYIHNSPIDNDSYINSISNNKHTINIAKYYKQNFQYIPRLKQYDAIVWIDGTIEIIYNKTSEYILCHIREHKIIGWNNEWREGKLLPEVENAMRLERYNSVFWFGQPQPLQDTIYQYKEYIKDGYDEDYFYRIGHHSKHFGIWVTCFIAFLNNDPEVNEFLDMWYLQTLKYTTQDQVGLPYVVQKTGLIPFTLPNSEIRGERPHHNTQFYIKHDHHL